MPPSKKQQEPQQQQSSKPKLSVKPAISKPSGGQAAASSAATGAAQKASKVHQVGHGRAAESKSARDVDDMDAIFAAKPAKTKKEDKPAPSAAGPDMAEIEKEAAKYKGSGQKGGRQYVDGLPVYTLEELQDEMGDSAWDAFQEAAEPGLS